MDEVIDAQRFQHQHGRGQVCALNLGHSIVWQLVLKTPGQQWSYEYEGNFPLQSSLQRAINVRRTTGTGDTFFTLLDDYTNCTSNLRSSIVS